MSQIRDTCGFPYQAFIGVKEYASKKNLIDVDIDGVQHECWDGPPTGTGAQDFIYGRASHDASYNMGDTQVRAFTMSQLAWSAPELVEPVTQKSISRDLFMDYLVFLKAAAFAACVEWNEAGRPHDWRPRISPKSHVDQIDDLLCMVGWPNAGV